MGKKFDVVIGNPPYQQEAQGTGTRDTPLYHLFTDAAYSVGKKVVLITPARFLSKAGLTPKAWNEKMLSDTHLSVEHFEPDAERLFPGTGIKGGVVVTYRDEGRSVMPIGTFTATPELNTILTRVASAGEQSIAELVSSSSAHRYTVLMHAENPRARQLMSSSAQFKVNTNAFDQLPFLFHVERPDDGQDYVRTLGLSQNKREYRWIRAAYLQGPKSMSNFKVAISKANGTGKFGEALAAPTVLGPGTAVTQSFITVGDFSDETTAEACLKYIKTKFCRTLLSVLKTTQDNPARVWGHIPLQDFTTASDIDWSKSIPEIDQQLYAKYSLDAEEIAFIEEKVKPMA